MHRSTEIEKLKSHSQWDIVIIGGGATGLGAALDAASRGLKVLCVEKNDFSKGTSSKSTKLIHGGVRYLEQGNFKLVKGALIERWFLLKNAPAYTQKIPFILPVYSWTKYIYYGLGLKFYDLLSGKLSIGKTRFLSVKNVAECMPNINTTGLVGGILYYDGQFDDSRVCLALAQKAVDLGATVINYCEATSFTYKGRKISGVVIKDGINRETMTVSAKIVINATGVFADRLMKEDRKTHKPIVTPSQGIHLVVDKSFYLSDYSLLIPKTTDKRVLFAVPWNDKVLIGTTDTKIKNISEEPQATSEEVDFVINNFNLYNSIKISRSDVLSIFAGLRPLVKMKDVKTTANLLRDHTIVVSNSNLITITGGKWTTYRKMAKDVINKALDVGGFDFIKCITKTITFESAIEKESIENDEIIHPSFDFKKSDVIHAVRNEMAMTLEDILARRLRILFLDAKAAVESAEKVAEIMKIEMKQTDGWKLDQINAFKLIATKYTINGVG